MMRRSFLLVVIHKTPVDARTVLPLAAGQVLYLERHPDWANLLRQGNFGEIQATPPRCRDGMQAPRLGGAKRTLLKAR